MKRIKYVDSIQKRVRERKEQGMIISGTLLSAHPCYHGELTGITTTVAGSGGFMFYPVIITH